MTIVHKKNPWLNDKNKPEDPVSPQDFFAAPHTGQTLGGRKSATQIAEEFAGTFDRRHIPTPAIEASDLYRADQIAPIKPITRATGLSDEFFETERQKMKDQLREEFFGPVGTLQQTASAESAAGRLGSGVGKRIIEETAVRPFAQAMTDVDRNILQAKISEKARVEGINIQSELQEAAREFERRGFNAQQTSNMLDRIAELRAIDSKNETQANIAMGEINAEFNRLEAAVAQFDAGTLSTEQMKSLDAILKEIELANQYTFGLWAAQQDFVNLLIPEGATGAQQAVHQQFGESVKEE